MANDWFYRVDGRDVGPISSPELVRCAADGTITPKTEVRRGDGPWVVASRVSRLFERATEVPAVAFPPPIPTASRGASGGAGGVSSEKEIEGKIRVLDVAEDSTFRVEILAYEHLGGASDDRTVSAIYYADRVGVRLKQVRMTLNDGEAIAEAGALHFMHGRIELESKIGGVAGLGKALVNKYITRETAVMPRYRGTGQIYLEPSFGHFLIYRLEDEEIIAEKGMFYCGQGSLAVGAVLQKNLSSALFGGEGWFQTHVSGTGICVFELPVPADEVRRIDLDDETLQVDGNFALMRTGDIDFSVEKSTKGIVGTLTSGEGLLQTFRGTGTVWIAPTQSIYPRLRAGGIGGTARPTRSSHTAT